jgi:putative ABC transport system permease protein
VWGAAAVGLLAVRRAVLPPPQRYASEALAHFRATVLERLGFGRFLTPVGQMMLRNIERKPVQASLSVLGLALATAILVVGGFNRDAINRLIDVQFQHVQREDLTVTFIEPRPARARYEVARLPGVIGAEPYRSVAVRLRAGHRTRRVALTGRWLEEAAPTCGPAPACSRHTATWRGADRQAGRNPALTLVIPWSWRFRK